MTLTSWSAMKEGSPSWTMYTSSICRSCDSVLTLSFVHFWLAQIIFSDWCSIVVLLVLTIVAFCISFHKRHHIDGVLQSGSSFLLPPGTMVDFDLQVHFLSCLVDQSSSVRCQWDPFDGQVSNELRCEAWVRARESRRVRRRQRRLASAWEKKIIPSLTFAKPCIAAKIKGPHRLPRKPYESFVDDCTSETSPTGQLHERVVVLGDNHWSVLLVLFGH